MKGVHSHIPSSIGQEGRKGDLADSRPLTTHDPKWNVTLEAEGVEKEGRPEEGREGMQVLDREELLSKVGEGKEGRRYQGYFVVNRT